LALVAAVEAMEVIQLLALFLQLAAVLMEVVIRVDIQVVRVVAEAQI
jgi:hypothetical protein